MFDSTAQTAATFLYAEAYLNNSRRIDILSNNWSFSAIVEGRLLLFPLPLPNLTMLIPTTPHCLRRWSLYIYYYVQSGWRSTSFLRKVVFAILCLLILQACRSRTGFLASINNNNNNNNTKI